MWIELHNELLDHPKLIRLINKLKIEKVFALGLLISLWLWASKYAQDGDLAKFGSAEIALGSGWNENPDVWINALVEVHFLDKTGSQLLIHDWDKYGIRILVQSRQRQKKYRDRERLDDGIHANKGSVAFNTSRPSL